MPEVKSLQRAAFRIILMVSALFLLILGGINLVMNTIYTMQSYKRETAHDLEYAVSLIDAQYLEDLASRTRQVYDSVPEEIRNSPYSEEYTQYLYGLVDDEFWKARDILVLCREKTGLDSVTIIMPDMESERLIYLIDGYDLEGAYLPGQWVSEEITDIDTPDEIEKIIKSNFYIKVGKGEINGWIGTNYVRVYDSKGSFLGYATGDINITSFFRRIGIFTLIYLIAVLAAVGFIAVKVNTKLRASIITPINTLALTAQEYTKRDKAQADTSINYFEPLNIRTGYEIDVLWKSLCDMEQDIDSTMIRIREMTSEKERVEAELSVATRIQEGVLPKEFPAFPGRKEFDIYAYMKPAKEVGGDLYDFFLIDDDHLCMVVGDVSGKGVPAALFMAVAATVIKNVARVEKDIPAIMKEVNRQMCKNNRESLFVTIWLGIYTISERTLRCGNAGHEDPAIYRAKEGCYSLYTTEHDIPMGIMEEMEYREEVFSLEPGDKFFIYSDGVPEATRGDDALYGPERMTECLNRCKDLGGRATVEAVREDVDSFVEGADQFDDMTMLYFEVR